MGEIDPLAVELSENKYVSHIERGTEGSIRFNVDHGAHNSLPSEILTILGRWDVDLYSDLPGHTFKYVVMLP